MMAEKQTPLLKALSIFGIEPEDSPAFDHLKQRDEKRCQLLLAKADSL